MYKPPKTTGKPANDVHDSFKYFLNQAFAPFAILTGKELIFTFANAAYVELMNGRELVGKSLEEAIPEIMDQPFLSLLQNVLETGIPFHSSQIEATAVFAGNSKPATKYFNLSYTPYKNKEGVTEGILASGYDVTEEVILRRKEKNQVLNMQAYDLFMHAPVGFCLTKGSDHIMELANKAFLTLTGREETVIGKPIIDIFPEADVQGYLALFNNVLKNKKALFLNETAAVFLKNGVRELFYLNIVLQPYFEDNEAVGILSILTDVTDHVISRKKVEESEERLRLAVESARLGTYELDLINNTIIYSPRIAELFGLDPLNELTHQDLKNALHPDDVSTRDEAHITANKTGNLFYEARVIGLDGFTHWLRLNGKVVFDSNGKALKNYGTVMDITKEKEREDILKESQQKFEMIAETIPHMVWEIEIDGKVSYINKQWQNWSGLTLEEINKNGWSKVTHPDDVESVTEGWQHAFETQNEYVGECRFKNPEGGYSWFTLKTVPVKNDAGEVEVWLGTATNINEKKLIEQQKDAFISIASHELKTPLTTLKAYGQIAETMLERKSDIETLQMVRRMSTQVNKLTTLIQDLLDISRIQQGKLIYNESFFDFNEAVREVINDMQKTTITHEIVNELDTSVKVYGDKEKLSQVINNFISNAIKYSPKAANIIVKTSLQNNGVLLSVQDFGIGISPAEQEHVFEQFYRVTGDSQSTFPGMGIGLYICSEIIKSMGGKIWVESRINAGSTFYISLPFDHRTNIN
jgi:PAS domain S-box-containing protein